MCKWSSLFDNSDAEVQELIDAAIEARTFSYRWVMELMFSIEIQLQVTPQFDYQFSPYSKFKVGAALRLANGTIKSGCNVENGAYAPSICAEQTAGTKAISEGHRDFRAVAIIADQEKSFTTPCGVCRQFLAEFVHDDMPVYVTRSTKGKVLITSLHSLLPMGFIPMKEETNKV